MGAWPFFSSRESCDMMVMHFLLGFFGYPEGAATELHGGTLKLRYSSAAFSKRFPSWPVSDLISGTLVVGSSPVSRFHFLDGDLVSERPVKRFRIAGKSTAGKRTAEFLGKPPTLKRWKKVDPSRIEAIKG